MRRPRPLLLCAAVLAVTLAGCGAAPTSLRWDLARADSTADLGDTSPGGTLITHTPGSNRIDLEVVLPDGTVVDGQWSSAVARPALDGSIDVVDIAAVTTTDADDWQSRIDRFVDLFGADRAEIDSWLDTTARTLSSGGYVPRRRFDGRPAAGYTPSITLWPSDGNSEPLRLVVEWNFNLD